MISKESIEKLREQLKEHLSRINNDIHKFDDKLTDEEYENKHLVDYHKKTNILIKSLNQVDQEILHLLLSWNEFFGGNDNDK